MQGPSGGMINARLAWLAVVLCAACGARTAVLADEELSLVPDAAPPPKDAGRDVPHDSPLDVYDAGVDAPCDACVRILADDQNGFFEIHAPEGTLQQLGPTPFTYAFPDIALAPDKKTLYGTGTGVGVSDLVIIDMNTWTTAGSIPGAPEMNALEVGQDGTIYGAEWDTVYAGTPGNVAQPLTKFPSGLHSSGDLAFVGGHLFATVFATTYDALVEIDLAARQTRVVGQTQAHCIFGLVGADPVPLLYGVTCDGELVQIDPATAETKFLAAFQGRSFLGATRL